MNLKSNTKEPFDCRSKIRIHSSLTFLYFYFLKQIIQVLPYFGVYLFILKQNGFIKYQPAGKNVPFNFFKLTEKSFLYWQHHLVLLLLNSAIEKVQTEATQHHQQKVENRILKKGFYHETWNTAQYLMVESITSNSLAMPSPSLTV